jgi:hypothetical protein
MKKNDLVQGGDRKNFTINCLFTFVFSINRSPDDDSNRKHSKRKTRE